MRDCRENGVNWGCHDGGKICAGFVETCAEVGQSYRDKPTIEFQDWAHEGMTVAVVRAK